VLNGTRRTFQLAESEISVDKIIRLSSIGDPVIYDPQSNITLHHDSEGLFKSYDFSEPDKVFEVKQRLLPYVGRDSLSSSSSGRNPPQNKDNNTLQGNLLDTNSILVTLILLSIVVLFLGIFVLYKKNAIWSVVIVGLVFIGWMSYLLFNNTTKSTLPRSASVNYKSRDINITKTEKNGPAYVKVATMAEMAKLKKKDYQ